MNTTSIFDAAAIGLGAVGSAALYQISCRTPNVIGFGQFDPPHVYGSSHGDSRITRLGVGEGKQYGPLVKRSHEVWRTLEQETGQKLLLQCEVLIIGGGLQIVIPWNPKLLAEHYRVCTRTQYYTHPP